MNITSPVLTTQNPGSFGKGIPSLHQLSRDLMRGARALLSGKTEEGWNRLRAASANFAHFYLMRTRDAAVCPCCGWRGSAFIAGSNWRAPAFQSSCPSCDSRSRHRGLWIVLESVLHDLPSGELLIFAPERILVSRITMLAPDRTLRTTDFYNQDVDYPGEDIQKLTFTEGRFAFLMCNHVLEHVPDDNAAISECARILAPGGTAIFTIPGDYPKRETVTFDQPDSNGHLRHYGMDIIDRFEAAFSAVEVRDMSAAAAPSAHVRKNDMVFVCHR
ncbi:MAG: methyltransferase domain-containing protein [Chloroflexota bacterium]|nr:methyltransferase domain-containing protein [Chloroflexota bacterium]